MTSGLIVSGKDGAGCGESEVSVNGGPTTEGKEGRGSDD